LDDYYKRLDEDYARRQQLSEGQKARNLAAASSSASQYSALAGHNPEAAERARLGAQAGANAANLDIDNALMDYGLGVAEKKYQGDIDQQNRDRQTLETFRDNPELYADLSRHLAMGGTVQGFFNDLTSGAQAGQAGGKTWESYNKSAAEREMEMRAQQIEYWTAVANDGTGAYSEIQKQIARDELSKIEAERSTQTLNQHMKGISDTATGIITDAIDIGSLSAEELLNALQDPSQAPLVKSKITSVLAKKGLNFESGHSQSYHSMGNLKAGDIILWNGDPVLLTSDVIQWRDDPWGPGNDRTRREITFVNLATGVPGKGNAWKWT
jgi:hypothetical protein